MGTKAVSRDSVVNVVVLASAVDAADKALLPASFLAMSAQMNLGPKELGALTFAQSIAFSLALPVWGSLMRFSSARDLMVGGCVLWACATFLLAMASSYQVHLALRLVVGFALASINPLGQAILCDIVPEEERGRAFGLQQAVSGGLAMIVSCATTAISMETVGGFRGWRAAHMAVAAASLLTGIAVHRVVPAVVAPPTSGAPKSWVEEQRAVVQAVAGKPSFIIMVAQGVTGGIPWNGFAFLTLYFQLSGYSDAEAGQIILWGGVGGVAGSLLGGKLGDWFARLAPNGGRCFVAQASVVMGTACFLWLMHVPYGRHSFGIMVLANVLFNFTACWTNPAALRPICGELFTSSHERAQILALWIALEGVISSVCGAPLVGTLSEAFGLRLSHDAPSPYTRGGGAGAHNVAALRHALLGVSIIPWALCAAAWVPMYWTYPRDRAATKAQALA